MEEYAILPGKDMDGRKGTTCGIYKTCHTQYKLSIATETNYHQCSILRQHELKILYFSSSKI
jgi:hypothetical protein